MNPIWAIQTNAVNRLQAEAVSNAVLEHGGRVCEVEVLPSTNTINFLTGQESGFVIPYGSTKLVELAMEKEWSGVFRNGNFSVPIWNEKRGDMLNSDSFSVRADELPKCLNSLSKDETIFIRPLVGKKLFPGQTATVADIYNWLKTGQVGAYPFPPGIEVSVAKNKLILAETRWFVVDGKVIDGSAYRLRGQRVLVHDINRNNLNEAQRFADVWLPHHTCVMDLATTEKGTRVIEFNTFNSSGFYQHDISKIVKAVHDMVRSKGLVFL